VRDPKKWPAFAIHPLLCLTQLSALHKETKRYEDGYATIIAKRNDTVRAIRDAATPNERALLLVALEALQLSEHAALLTVRQARKEGRAGEYAARHPSTT